MAKALALCRVVESNSQTERRVTFSLKGMPVMSCFSLTIYKWTRVVTSSVTASGFKGEGHETVAKVVEVILLPVLEGGSFASSIEILFGFSLDVEGASDREI